VVEAGRVVERGTHDDLLALGGRYASLYRTQFTTHPPDDDVACLVPGCDLVHLSAGGGKARSDPRVDVSIANDRIDRTR
jgi:hypothetical protein